MAMATRGVSEPPPRPDVGDTLVVIRTLPFPSLPRAALCDANRNTPY